jgi:hypothetical protein
MLRSQWTAGAAVLLIYGLWLAFTVPQSHNGRDFIIIGRSFAQRHAAGSSLRIAPPYYNASGYDGQFYYYIALDPVQARPHIDNPAYRYTRILYPIVARLLAFGQPDLIPYALITVNWLALAGGTLALAAWLRRKALSPWFALVYGLYPGLLSALHRDLTEPLSYALVALGIYLFDFGGHKRLFWAGISFALATLTREVCAVFGVTYGVALLFDRSAGVTWQARLAANWRRAALLLVLVCAPFALYKALLLLWLGSAGVPSTVAPVMTPFGGLFFYWPWNGAIIEQIIWVVLPGLICLGVAVWALYRRLWSVEVWVLVVNVALFVVLLNASSYVQIEASGRITAGVALAATLCLRRFDQVMDKNCLWFWASSVCWLSYLPFALLGSTAYNFVHAVRQFARYIVHHL